MVPYLAGFMQLRLPDGTCVELFNTCRTKANYLKQGRASGWDSNPDESVWGGYCNWVWDEGDYDDETNPDPWYDPNNPATREVAGFLLDVPDGSHGFYLEPSGDTRIVDAQTFQPLEMFFTGAIVSASSRGEGEFLKWMHKTLSNCNAVCDGWEAAIYTYYPCETDFDGVVFDEQGNQLTLPGVEIGEPERPALVCDPADSLQPGGDPAPYLDTGRRHIKNIRYLGYEQLPEGLHECQGNRYKFNFEVFSHEWVKPGLKVAAFNNTWDECACVATNRYTVCKHQERVACAELTTGTVGVIAPIVKPLSRALSNQGGVIALPGRYVRPDKVNLKSVLTPVMGPGNWVPSIVINNGDTETCNVRVSVWEALNNVPPPDTEDGWCVYRGVSPYWRADLSTLPAHSEWCFNPDGSRTVTCSDGTKLNGDTLSDVTDNCEACTGRFWVTVEASCTQPNDFTVDVLLHQVEPI